MQCNSTNLTKSQLSPHIALQQFGLFSGMRQSKCDATFGEGLAFSQL